MWKTVLTIFMFSLLLADAAFAAGNWPQFKENNGAPECEQALALADTVFKSQAFYLYEPPEVPEDLDSRLAAGPDALDISGGGGIKADTDLISVTDLPRESGIRAIYWQKLSADGARFALVDHAGNWQGNTYSLHLVPDTIGMENFRRDLEKNLAATEVDSKGYRPPLLLVDKKKAGNFWAVEVEGQSYFLSGWKIYGLKDNDKKPVCTIRFRTDVKNATDLLPPSVKKLAQLLDATMGSGQNEGTLNPTARKRIRVQYAWANIAQRPWVTKDIAYNTRMQVDSGLKQWALGVKSFYRLYMEINRQYPLARQALEKYYIKTFGMRPDEAKQKANILLDIAYRSHFAFHRTE